MDLIDSVGTDGVKEKEKKECEEKKTGWNRGEKMNEKKRKGWRRGKIPGLADCRVRQHLPTQPEWVRMSSSIYLHAQSKPP